MEPPDPHRAARQLVERISGDFKDLQAAGVEINGVGVGANDRVLVRLRRPDDAWIELIHSRYGDDVDFIFGGYARLV